jgi:TolB protein
MRIFRIICFLLIFLSLLCCKKKAVNSDDGLPHYWPRYTDMEPAWSPDGKTIAYIHGGLDYPDDPPGIFLINVDGTNDTLFYEGAKAYAPDFSPDGNWLVFWDNAQIFKIKLNGDSLTQLTFESTNFYPDWSPDGKKIAFDITETPEVRGIYMMNSDGSDNKMVPNTFTGRFPDWSPDGSQLVYIVYPGTGPQIFISDTNGSNQKQLTFLKDHDNRYPVFSPDGKKIAFSSAYNSAPVIYVMDSDGKNLKMLTPEGGDEPAWSPDGKYIAYTYVHPDYGRIFIMNADGTGKRQLTFKKSLKK